MNPIMQKLQRQNNPLGMLADLKRMMSGADPNAAAEMLIRQNPKLAEFVNANRGKSIDAVAQQYGIDVNQIMQLLK